MRAAIASLAYAASTPAASMKASRRFSQGERRNPQYRRPSRRLCRRLQHACDASPALQKINQAIELNPLCPDRYWWTAGDANFHLERYDDAIACMSRMRDQSPAYRLIAASWAMLGDRDQATEYVRKAKEIHPDFNVNGLAFDRAASAIRISHADYEQGLREAGFN